jgi:hypothetical protein
VSLLLLSDPSAVAAAETLTILDFTFIGAVMLGTSCAGVMGAGAVNRNMGSSDDLAL